MCFLRCSLALSTSGISGLNCLKNMWSSSFLLTLCTGMYTSVSLSQQAIQNPGLHFFLHRKNPGGLLTPVKHAGRSSLMCVLLISLLYLIVRFSGISPKSKWKFLVYA